LITPDCAGNVVGVDPHKRTVSASVADPRGGIVATEHCRVSGDGHRALEVWAGQFGPIARWGVEGASSWGRHTAIFLIARGYDVRDVWANRTPRSDRARQRGKSDQLDSERIARETLAHPLLPKAFKRAGEDRGPDEHHELLALRHNQRRSILTSRQHLINEAEHLLSSLPLFPYIDAHVTALARHPSKLTATAAGAMPPRPRSGSRCLTTTGHAVSVPLSRGPNAEGRPKTALDARSCTRPLFSRASRRSG